ncbi:hypothetical protein [Methylomonas koyamae]|uniref:Uncharacterized protein n=1 Tax=Methylomonas koyamae TaxID=702114 RepID=A0AA91D9Q4_9GAMM|nr:hypothetical protein [Methylomonas koyamae]OAI22765.1 hypothetical protein A1356_18690 [Methylomonas koyamae]
MKHVPNAISRNRTVPYLATDGALRFCVSAPLLEPPADFKEWYRPRQRPERPRRLESAAAAAKPICAA